MSLRLLVALALLAPLVAAPADACGVPCGRIYPSILMSVEGQAPGQVYNVTQGVPLTLEATLTFRFDAGTEGYTAPDPNNPIVVTFEFPRKPKWAELSVEPDRIPIPVTDPRYLKPGTPDPSAPPELTYEYATKVAVTALVTDRAVLRDGFDFGKLLVFAKSTESGLYQAGYGIKEIRVAPEGAVHESDVAGERDVFEAKPLPPLVVPEAGASVAGLSASVAAAGEAAWWQPTALAVDVTPVDGEMVLALHDERGALVAQAGPLDAALGEATLQATFVEPGLHTLTVTLLPQDGTAAPPVTIPIPFRVGDEAAEGWQYPKAYRVATQEIVPAPQAATQDPNGQFERDVPFFAYESAQSMSAAVSLVTPGLPSDRALANVQFSVHDPDGRMLQAGSVDPANPSRSIRITALPGDGWYVLRARGAGLPAGAAIQARVEIAYPANPVARAHADGVADATGGALALGGRNLTLPVADARVWSPTPFAPGIEGESVRYHLTVFDGDGTLAYATGARTGAASFTPPAPGTYRAYAYVEPVAPSEAFSPVVRAFTFGVGNDTTTVASKMRVEETLDLPVAAGETVVGIYQVRTALAVGAQGGSMSASSANLVLRYAAPDAPAPGGEPLLAGPLTLPDLGHPVFLVYASAPGAAIQRQGNLGMEADYGAPLDLVGPDAKPPAPPQTSDVPLGLAPLLAALALAALAGRRLGNRFERLK
ncbi:MAG TPA: hypothetical protein VHH36_05180 [Candidatus Thermoplasmatota archaeon]|nr:hypothetical protein [Candidatus Thermoplasmatota archaeon]